MRTLFVAAVLLFFPGILGVDVFCVLRNQCGNWYFMKITMWRQFWRANPALYWDGAMAQEARKAMKDSKYVTPPHTLRAEANRSFTPYDPRLEKKMEETIQHNFKSYFPTIKQLPFLANFGCWCTCNADESRLNMLCFFQETLNKTKFD